MPHAKRGRARLLKYSESEPRDDHGRWGAGGSEVPQPGHIGQLGYANVKQWTAAHAHAMVKISTAPRPTPQDIERNLEVVSHSNRAGGDLRGNSYARATRTSKLLSEFGDGHECPCVWCGKELDSHTLTQDKIYTMREGGRYKMPNLLPACLHCNQSRNDTSITQEVAA